MSCTEKTCGTGLDGINNPKPGDPDNNVALSARFVYGGISVSWSFPTTNPQAVAHTVVFRGLTSDVTKATEIARVGGSIHMDALDPMVETIYYYWIRFLTVNGTYLPYIGPVSATAKVRAQQTLETLTGMIDAGVLANSLKTDIGNINLYGRQLIEEIENRIQSNTALSGLIALVQSGQQDSMTYIQEEITNRTTADSAILDVVNTMAAAVAQNTAAIFTESQVRADKDTAMASQITALFSQSSSNTAALQHEITTRTDADSALATQITTLTSRVGTAEATIRSEATTRASEDAALSQYVNSMSSALQGNIASVQTSMQSQITTVNGKVSAIGSLYTVKLSVNGLVGGFGVYNDGTAIEAGFDVDTFWVGKTNANKVKPFIISGSTVYIDKARIRNADIDTLKIAGNAVTVPVSAVRYDTISGSAYDKEVMDCSVYMPEAGTIQAICTCSQSSSEDNRWWRLGLRIDGNEVAYATGANPSDSVALSGSMYLGPGYHTVTLWQNSGTGSRVINRNMTVLGAMR